MLNLEKHFDFIDGLELHLQLGYYYFFDYEDMLKEKFKNYHEFEEYDNFITSCEVLLTSSPQAVLECLASGGKPIYIQRNDYSKDFLEKFKELNIPIIMDYKREEILKIIKSIHN